MSPCLERSLNLYLVSPLIALLLAISCLAQEPAQSTPGQTAPSSQQKSEPKASKPDTDQSDQLDTDKSGTDKSNAAQPETKITAEQAEQLFHDVDTILTFAGNDTSLPKKHDVKR